MVVVAAVDTVAVVVADFMVAAVAFTAAVAIWAVDSLVPAAVALVGTQAVLLAIQVASADARADS
jgi:hypothetical protein